LLIYDDIDVSKKIFIATGITKILHENLPNAAKSVIVYSEDAIE
jgi:hypothetical protein